jgi:CDP-diacylglycerol---serine O-phosphatidyltransferase
MPLTDRASRRRHVLANVLTACNLAAGTGAVCSRRDSRVRSGLIMLGALCDSFDGSLARRSGYLTDEGARADGICDVVTCGIAPAVVLGSLDRPRTDAIDRFAPRIYIAAIVWRVVKYGFPPREGHVFTGMPVTGAGTAMAVGFQLRLPPRAMTYVSLAVVGTMLSRIPVLSGEAMLRRSVRQQGRRPSGESTSQ